MKMFRRFRKFLTALAVASVFSSLTVNGGAASKAESGEIVTTGQAADYGRFPVLFEENKGQTDRAAKFISRVSGGYSVYLTEKGADFSLKLAVEEQGPGDESKHSKTKAETQTRSEKVRMEFVGANEHPRISGNDEAITKTNYYIGKKRLENIGNYRRVNYSGLYNGIDAVFYGNEHNQLEYDFLVAPNADANKIGLKFDGARNISVDPDGNLVIKTENAELVQQKPIAYQEIGSEKREIEVRYVIDEQSQIADRSSQISFELGEYDSSLPLVIDPALSYLTYIGGTGFDNAFDIAADANGNAYVTGTTSSLNFHGDTRADNDGSGSYVAKINADGTAFLYVTILEGNGNDEGKGVAVDASGNAYATGRASHFFPTTSGAYDTVHGVLNNNDVYVTKLNTAGNIVYSSFLGGTDSDIGFDIAVDASGKAYVAGETDSNTAFPTKNRYQGCGIPVPLSFDSTDAFLTVMNAAGSDITYSSCIGNTVGVQGFSDESAIGIALDSSNNAYLTGDTKSNSFKTKNAAQSTIGGGTDAWVAKFVPTQSGDASVAYATFLGGSGTDIGFGIAVDSTGQAHVTGITGSTNFPLQNAFDTTNVVNEAFLTRYTSSGGLSFSSFLGGSNQEEGDNITVDNRGSVYVCGNTASDDFPLALPFQSARRGLRDAFVTKIRIGAGVVSSTLLGGNGNDKAFSVAVRGNHMFIAGPTESNNLLTTLGALKATSNASSTNADGFVAKILDTRLESVGVFRPTATFILTQSITNVVAQNATFTTGLSGARGVSGDWDGDGIDTIGSFTNGTWKIRNSNFPIINPPFGGGISTINFGQVGDLPVVGDWNNDGIETIAVFRPSTGQFFATNSLVANPPVDFTVTFGQNGDLPVAGDWNGDGVDTMGVYRPSAGQFFLTNTNDFNANIDITTFFGVAEDLPFAGDFNGDGIDSISVWRPSVATFFITNDNTSLATAFPFGAAGDQPIAGDWDGRPLP